MADKPSWLLLLQAPVLWFRGLPGPPDDSLCVPRDSGLPGATMPPAVTFPWADAGSE